MNSVEGEYFNTHVTIIGACFEEVLSSALLECDKFEKLLSRTIPGSDVWKLNHGEATASDVSEHTRRIMELADVFKEETDGLYNISWSGEMDMGSIAKGYIADRIGDFLRSAGVTSALINLGGNILTLGRNQQNEPWRIGLQYPALDKTKRSLCYGVVLSEDDSVVTSGIYERGHWDDGAWESHIIDPRTGKSINNGVLSVTVKSDTSFMADAITTPLLLLGPEKGFELAAKYGVQTAYYMSGDKVLFSEGFVIENV